MNSNAWPLVFFTLLSQLSVGIVAGGLVLLTTFRSAETGSLAALYRIILLLALITMGVALALSFLHLSRPWNAILSLSNVHASFLSREILLASLYFFMLGTAFITLYFIGATSVLSMKTILGIILLVGLLLIWAMAKVYMISTVPIWSHPSTLLRFLLSALLLGTAAIWPLLTIKTGSGFEDTQSTQMRCIYFTLVNFFILISTLVEIWSTRSAGEMVGPMVSHSRLISMLFIVRIGLLAAVLAGLYWFIFRAAKHQTHLQDIPAYGLFILLLISEIIGRYNFYASYQRVGV